MASKSTKHGIVDFFGVNWWLDTYYNVCVRLEDRNIVRVGALSRMSFKAKCYIDPATVDVANAFLFVIGAHTYVFDPARYDPTEPSQNTKVLVCYETWKAKIPNGENGNPKLLLSKFSA